MRSITDRRVSRWALLLLPASVVLALVLAMPAAAADSDQDRNVAVDELDAMLSSLLSPLPTTGEIELFSTVTRPAISPEEAEKWTKGHIERMKARGETHDDATWEAILKANIDGNVEWFSTPALELERFVFRDDARRIDFTSSAREPKLTPQTPFFETLIEPGSSRSGDNRLYKYIHWNRLPQFKASSEKLGPGHAFRSNQPGANSIRDIREELIGVDRMLLEILAAEVCELPKPPLTKVPEARELPLDPKKIEALLADKGSIRLRVSELYVDGEKRLRIRLLSPKGWGILATKELTPFAEIVVKADDFRAVYEQRLFDTKGAETVVVTADGFDDQGIPKEKTWVRRRPDGQHETTSYAILNAKVNIDIPAAEFEFNPPEGYLVDVMGPDGRPIKSDAPPPPVIERKPFTNRLWGLNLLAVLVLAAFTIRKFLLRRQTAAGG